MQLTRNFSRTEFDVHEPYPREWETTKLPQLARLAQWLRDLAGVPGQVTSAYRNPARNAGIPGAATNSQHVTGEAIDLEFLGISLRELATRVLESERRGEAPPYGQLIFYADTGHVHVSLQTRKVREKLVAMQRAARRVYETFALERLPALPNGAGTAVALVLAAFFFPALS